MIMNIIRLSPHSYALLRSGLGGLNPKLMSGSPVFLEKLKAGEGWEPVVGPGFVGLHPKPGEIRRNLPVCVSGLWVRRSWGLRWRSLQPLVPSSAAKWEGWVCHGIPGSPFPVLWPLLPKSCGEHTGNGYNAKVLRILLPQGLKAVDTKYYTEQ